MPTQPGLAPPASGLRGWLSLVDPELPARDRFLLTALRVVLAAVIPTSLVLLALPFRAAESARQGSLGDVGVGALILLLSVLPLWLLPYAVWQTGALRVDGAVLTAYTLRDRRVFDLQRVQRVRVWTLGAGAHWVKLSGEGIPTVWLNWSSLGFGTSERVQTLVRGVVTRRGVFTNPSARELFELPEAPHGWASLARWAHDLSGVVTYGLLMAAAVITYVNALFGFAPWTVP